MSPGLTLTINNGDIYIKKTLISLLLVLLTITLFISCSSSPKEEITEKAFTLKVVLEGNVHPVEVNWGRIETFGELEGNPNCSITFSDGVNTVVFTEYEYDEHDGGIHICKKGEIGVLGTLCYQKTIKTEYLVNPSDKIDITKDYYFIIGH